MEINGDYPSKPADLWEGHHSRFMNVGQQCHMSDWMGWSGGWQQCPKTARVLIGQFFEFHHLGFCAKHWYRFLDTMREEASTARDEDHWLLRIVAEEYSYTFLRQASERASEEQREADRRYYESRRAERYDALLADRFEPGSRVYFIQAGKRGPIKIGVASNVYKRLDALQTGNPHRLYLRATVPGDVRTEREYHGRFADHQMHGEWFKPARPILDEIKALRAVAKRGEGALF